MKSIIAVITFSFLFNFTAFGQEYITKVKPQGAKEWGYMNANGDQIVSAKYKKCYHFSENGLPPIYVDKKFYFINKSGERLKTEITGFKIIEGGFGFAGADG